ncbi:DUF5312 family protein [Spirochaetia bacterium 38H-sp]|uniref:DUF5312 family protein n=1 Tax=Rarispira pelagica TaxID=3141764 RepID=A0ABU9UCQ9_9SPIR
MPTLEELAHSLAPEERKDLLKKIESSLFGVNDDKGEPIYPKIFSEEQREFVILQKMRELSIFERIVLWFRNLFTARSKEEAFLQLYLSKKRKKINRLAFDMFNLRTFSIKPGFLEYLIALDISSRFLLDFYRTLWGDKSFFVELIHETLNTMIPSCKKELFDFISREEIFNLFLEGKSRENVKKILRKKIESYLESIPKEIFRDMDYNLLPLFAARNLVFFPYGLFYNLFNVSDPDTVSDFSTLREVGFSKCEHLLERLYYAVSVFNRFIKYDIPDAIFKYYYSYIQSKKEKDEKQFYDVDSLKSAFKSLREATINFYKKIPLSDFFQVVHKDPFYRFYIYVPSIDAKNFYSSSLILHIIGEYDDSVLDIIRDVISSLNSSLFPFGKERMDNLNTFATSRLKTLFPHSFMYIESFSVIFTVFKRWYIMELRDFFETMAKAIPTRFKNVLTVLNSINKDIDDFLSEMISFEQSFSLDNPDGRLLFISEDRTAVSDVQRHLIDQKGKEAYEIVNAARGIISKFGDFFDRLIDILPDITDIAEEYYTSDEPFQEYVYGWRNKIKSLDLLLNLLKDSEHDLFFK